MNTPTALSPLHPRSLARSYARVLMLQAREAKMKGRPTVVAHYVRQARCEMKRGLRGEFGTAMDFALGVTTGAGF